MSIEAPEWLLGVGVAIWCGGIGYYERGLMLPPSIYVVKITPWWCFAPRVIIFRNHHFRSKLVLEGKLLQHK